MKIDIMNIPQYQQHMGAITVRGTMAHYENATTYQSLRKLEAQALRITTRWCNGVTEEQEAKDEKALERIVKKVEVLLPLLAGKVFVNYDARGYALKVKECDKPSGMYTDWGSYGIVAPVF